MAVEFQNEEEISQEHFRKQLAGTVRNIQWSYAIFWSESTRQPGVLAWRDGYYNGDIKTRKTTQSVEPKADQMGLQRSDQLRELYESLSTGDSNQQTRRPSASLSPEDLTDTEWYYVVCMSFTFNPGQGLPGRTLSSNRHMWLSNAHFADSKVFTRSLLAKSASVQTVVCFPFMGGVLELGTSEQVSEDPALIQHVRTCFWELQNPACSELSVSSSPMAENDEDNMCPILDSEVVDTMALENHMLSTEIQTPMESGSPGLPFALHSYAPLEEAELIQDKIQDIHHDIHEELKAASPDPSSNGFYPNQHTDETLRTEGLFRDDFSNGFHGSLNASDCISQSFMNPQMVLSSPKGERVNNNVLDYLREGNYTKLVSLDLNGDDSHYTRTLSDILRNSKQLTLLPYFSRDSHESGFSVWKRNSSSPKPLTNTPQRLLKKILMDAVWMHSDQLSKTQEDNGIRNKMPKSEGDDAGASHVLSERRRREKLNEKFVVLRSLVPSISKVDKASILGDTIEYLKELERRVEELESCREVDDLDAKGRRKHLDITERTSDNYGSNQVATFRRISSSKRKACDIEEAEAGQQWLSIKDGPVEVNVTMVDREVQVEVRCPERDCLLLEILEAISNLHLDAHSVQSSTVEGFLALTLRAKIRGSMVGSPGMLKSALRRIVSKR